MQNASPISFFFKGGGRKFTEFACTETAIDIISLDRGIVCLNLLLLKSSSRKSRFVVLWQILLYLLLIKDNKGDITVSLSLMKSISVDHACDI